MKEAQAEAELAAERLARTVDRLRAELNELRAAQLHERALVEQRLHTLENQAVDHESRIRTATDGVIQFKVWSGLASGGSSIMALIAFVKSFFGAP